MRYLLQHGTVWDPGGGKSLDILVEGERILKLAPELAAEPGEQVLDLTGMTVFPGFFNAHVHLYGVHGPLPDDLIRRFALGGVTTLRDMGMTSPEPYASYAAWLSERTGPEYPTILHSGKFLCGEHTYGNIHPSGQRIGRLVETEEEARQAVDEMLALGAMEVKTGMDPGQDPAHPLEDLPDAVFSAICARAAECGSRSAAHITKTEKLLHAAQLGLTEGAHVPIDSMHDAQAEALAASGIAFTATLSIFDMVSSETGEPILEDAIANTCRLYRAGLPMAVGTDFMFENPPYQTVGIPVHEFRLLHRAGLSVNEILLAATEGSAQVCGVSEETGSIQPGKLADLVAVAAPIDESFQAFETVLFVMHRGTVLKHESK